MKYQSNNLVPYDLEVVPNFFLFGALFDGKVVQFDQTQIPELQKFLRYIYDNGHQLVGFNNQGYDDCLLAEIFANPDKPANEIAYRTSVDIIEHGHKPWEYEVQFPTVDLMRVLPGRLSLKKVGVILAHKKLQEMPIDFHSDASPEEIEMEKVYNVNDLEITQKLLDALQPDLDLRAEMSREYGTDLPGHLCTQIDLGLQGIQ